MSEVPPKTPLDFVKTWGKNANSFLSLYPGFLWFYPDDKSINGAIAYVETKNVWVASGDPLSSLEDMQKLLKAFADHAIKNGKTVIFIPVSEETAALAREVGYGSLYIGSEPTFELKTYSTYSERGSWADIMHTSRLLHAKGAVVSEFRPENITKDQKRELDKITAEWLNNRKIAPLGFLNRVEPWESSEHKKYFLISFSGKILAFVAAIPIWARNGWYLIDVLKRKKTPAGTVEMLLLESMRILKDEGAAHVSLGVAPLSNLSKATDRENKKFIYKTLDYVYEHLNQFYNFKSLHEFKEKFTPTQSEPSLLIHYPQKLGVKQIESVLSTFIPGGIKVAIFSFLKRYLLRFDFFDTTQRLFQFNIVTLGPCTPTITGFLNRCKFTVVILTGIWFIYLVSPELNQSSTVVFSGSALPNNWLQSLLFAQFYHINLAHIVLNTALIFILVGTVEYSLGTSMALLSFFVPSTLSNLLSLMLLYPISFISEPFWKQIFNSKDVGSSLGAFGCLGVLVQISKRRSLFLFAAIVSSVIAVLAQRDMLEINHLIALAIGFFFAKIIL